MEYSLRKYSGIALILIDLLDCNYECTRYCIKTLKDIEISDARKYHLERYKLRSGFFSTYSTYSFLFSLKGIINLQGKKKRKNRKILLERFPQEKVLTTEEILEKYDEILSMPELSDEQRDIILKMKNTRLLK